VIAFIITNPPDQDQADLVSLAVGLRAHLGSAEVLTPGECLLLNELLDRLAKPPKD
jgi:hypothetical protein